jgi:hypothetical protein
VRINYQEMLRLLLSFVLNDPKLKASVCTEDIIVRLRKGELAPISKIVVKALKGKAFIAEGITKPMYDYPTKQHVGGMHRLITFLVLQRVVLSVMSQVILNRYLTSCGHRYSIDSAIADDKPKPIRVL